MYSNSSQAETIGITRHEDRPTYLTSNSHPHYYPPPRPSPLEPRQLELRPPVPSSWTESQSVRSPLPHDSLRNAISSTPSSDSRPQGQSLPGLRDILSSPTETSHRPPFPSWNSPSNARPNYEFGRPVSAHPPLTLQPSADAYSAPQPPAHYESRGMDRRPSVPPSPYPPIHQSQHTQPQSQHSHGSYLSQIEGRRASIQNQHQNGPQSATRTPSSYPPNASDDVQMNGPPSANLESASHPAANTQPPSGEGLGKYVRSEKTSEGTFHLYEGGGRLPAVIDGESVNPQWGLTKANKPRKRLALACLDCREKKIKCEPGENSCLQCEKAKRPCRKAPTNPPPETTPIPERSESTVSSVQHSVAAPPPILKRPHECGFVHPDFKRPRPGSPIPSFGPNTNTLTDPYRYHPARPMPTELDGRHPLSMEIDPYVAYPEWTMQLLNLFFNNLNHYSPFPAKRFMRWVAMPEAKNENERAALYSTLAFASCFTAHFNSYNPQMMVFGDHCAQIATDTVLQRMARPNLCLCITRMMLGLYHFAKGRPEICWDHVGAGIASTLSIGIYTEHGCHVDKDADAGLRAVFDFTKHQLIECKRRVYWCLFVLERLGAIPKCTLKPEDTFLRLPCSEEVYEHGLPSEAPFYDNDILEKAATRLTPTSPVSSAAWLINIAAIQGDVVEFSQRLRYRAGSTYLDAYEEFYTQTNQRLRWWLASLPDHLRYNKDNLERRFLGGCGGVFLSMHTFHHHLVMLLNRTVQHGHLSETLIKRNIQAAIKAGHGMVDMICALREAKRADEKRENIALTPEGIPANTPTMWGTNVSFAGYTTLLAIDAVTSGGFDWELRKIFRDSKRATNYLLTLRNFWQSAAGQSQKTLKRCYQIQNIMVQPHRSPSGAWLGERWGLAYPCLEDDAEVPSLDVVYGVPNYEVFFSSFEEPTEEQKELARISLSDPEDNDDILGWMAP